MIAGLHFAQRRAAEAEPVGETLLHFVAGDSGLSQSFAKAFQFVVLHSGSFLVPYMLL